MPPASRRATRVSGSTFSERAVSRITGVTSPLLFWRLAVVDSMPSLAAGRLENTIRQDGHSRRYADALDAENACASTSLAMHNLTRSMMIISLSMSSSMASPLCLSARRAYAVFMMATGGGGKKMTRGG